MMRGIPQIAKLALLVAFVVPLGGCQMFRAQAGYGFGVGADFQFPGIVKTGLGIGEFYHYGPNYDRGTQPIRQRNATALIWHWEKDEGATEEYRTATTETVTPEERARIEDRLRPEYTGFCLFPPLTSVSSSRADPWKLEIGVMLLFVDLRLGFSPLAGSGGD